MPKLLVIAIIHRSNDVAAHFAKQVPCPRQYDISQPAIGCTETKVLAVSTESRHLIGVSAEECARHSRIGRRLVACFYKKTDSTIA